MKEKEFNGYIGRTVEESVLSYKEENKHTGKRPNVIYILLDDLGFADFGCYGSEIRTPNIDRLAERGLRYNNFHTTAICSATRTSLLTGTNHHAAGVAILTDIASGFPNGIGHVDPAYANIAEILKEQGYHTFLTGKWHLTDQKTENGDFENWPLARGFDRYYGFLAGATDQYYPYLVQDNSFVDQPALPSEGYHLSEDLADHAIQYIFTNQMESPDEPFFLYLPFGAMHAPHQAPKEYIESYRGAYDAGWDVIREQRFRKQKEIGIIPQDAVLTPRNELAKPWDELSEKEKAVYVRHMEVYAAFLTHTDKQIGRVIDYLEEIEQLENTIIVLMSDNGASSEGGCAGKLDFSTNFCILENDEEIREQVDVAYENLDKLGSEYSSSNYPIGWANVSCTPFQWFKVWAHEGGVKDPMIISYPEGIEGAGGVRNQYVHVSDVTPTILELLDVKKPEVLKGITQKPMTGTSFAYSLTDAEAESRKRVQYYEMMGNRGIYKDGWKAVVNHAFSETYADDEWELYHVDEDYSESKNVAEQYPEKLKELQDEWLIEAGKNNVFPLVKGMAHTQKEVDPLEMLNGRDFPTEQYTFKHVIYPYVMKKQLRFKNNSYSVKIDLDRDDSQTEGVLVSFGTRFQGFSVYVQKNRVNLAVAAGNLNHYEIRSDTELPVGRTVIRYDYIYDKIKRVAKAILFVGGVNVGEMEFPQDMRSIPNNFVCFKQNIGAPVSDNYDSPFVYRDPIRQIDFWISGNTVSAEDAWEDFWTED
ncbi:MAG: arylsulfatase [Eubacterium sp.]|nr:arylsulfatase [Eubacterium sp.]